jgi:hypothetical protein
MNMIAIEKYEISGLAWRGIRKAVVLYLLK